MPEVTQDYEIEADPDDPVRFAALFHVYGSRLNSRMTRIKTDMAVAGIRVNLRARMFHFDQIAAVKVDPHRQRHITNP